MSWPALAVAFLRGRRIQYVLRCGAISRGVKPATIRCYCLGVAEMGLALAQASIGAIRAVSCCDRCVQ
jgi:hypothetical protein